jgi:hypothetical protein
LSIINVDRCAKSNHFSGALTLTNLRRHSHGERVSRHHLIVGDHGTRTDCRAGVDEGLVQHNRAGTYESTIVNSASFEVSEMPDDAIRTHESWEFSHCVNYGAILN